MQVLSNVAAYSDYGLLTRCDIRAKTVELSGIQGPILQLFIEKYNLFIVLQLIKKSQ
jgi:hypothetical protein